MNPRVSVLLPVKNAAATLDEALDSMWRQTWNDFEVLAVDDGSTDASTGILAHHGAREPRLQTLANPGHGLIDALEAARGRARAPYLARMDADDRCHPERFRLQLEYLEAAPEVAAVGSRVKLFPRADVGPGWRRYEAWLNSLVTPEAHQRELFVESPLAHPSVMCRRDAVHAVGGYQDRGWPEDYDLWLRLAAAGWKLAKIKETLLEWRQSPGRHSLTAPRYSRQQFQAARAHYLAAHDMLAGGTIALWGAGRTGRRLGRLLQDEGVKIERYYDVDPKKIGNHLGGAPVFSWKDLDPPGALPLVVAVGAAGARALIRPETARRGYVEGVTLLFAA